jgi:di/tricarboxylate transporter
MINTFHPNMVFVNGQNATCNVCDRLGTTETLVISKPSQVILAETLSFIKEDTTCSALQLQISSGISVFKCAMIATSAIPELCGCALSSVSSLSSPIQVPVPAAAPVVLPAPVASPEAKKKKVKVPVWHQVVVSLTLAIMLGIMMFEYIGPDWVFVAGLTVFMVTEIVTVKEGLAGFSNEGLWTVMALFIVAEGLSRTGALDYYLGKILGRPKTVAGAQIRLMIPIALLSAFLNNTPIVVVMIPVVLRWGKNIGVPRQQLLIPLSYATILGGTCTLVGTSTNLVVSGLLQEDYRDERAGNIGLFDVGLYGVPNALIGLCYMLVFAPFLLPHGNVSTNTETEELLFGARVTAWSPSAGRTVRRSGLAESGGVYLVNVRRPTTGNVHHSVSSDFVLSVGDEVYFTGNHAEFSAFCEKHGLEIITNDGNGKTLDNDPTATTKPYVLGTTKESIMKSEEAERIRFINQLSDTIQEREVAMTTVGDSSSDNQPRIVVTADMFHTEGAILVGIDCLDRPGLLMAISQLLFKNNIDVRHSEARVVTGRSLSVWRCEKTDSSPLAIVAVWQILSDLITNDHNTDPVAVVSKRTGAHVVRAVVTKESSLIGKAAADEVTKFRQSYKAGIIAFQKNGRNATTDKPFGAGDVLVLEVDDISPLLQKPPKGFYAGKAGASKNNQASSSDVEGDLGYTRAWKDLQVVFDDENGQNNLEAQSNLLPRGEFLTAFTVPKNSNLIGKTLNDADYTRLPGVVLVSIERPGGDEDKNKYHDKTRIVDDTSTDGTKVGYSALSPNDILDAGDVIWYTGSASAIADLQKVNGFVFYQEDEINKAIPVLQDRRILQAVVAKGSPLIGKTVKESRFRTQYGAVILAVQRGNNRVHEYPGDIVLQLGDTLLIDASPDFLDRYENSYKTFSLLSEVQNSSPPRPQMFWVCVVLIIASLTVASLDDLDVSLLVTSSIVGIFMLSFGVVTQQEAREAFQWDLYVVIGAAFGVANAMTKSGVAEGMATFLVKIGLALNIGGRYL